MIKNQAHYVNTSIAQRVRNRRLQTGMSIITLATVLDVTPQQMRKYETAKNQISNVKLYEIAKFLGVSINYFFESLYDKSSIAEDLEQLSLKDMANLTRSFGEIKDFEIRKEIMRFIRVMANSA